MYLLKTEGHFDSTHFLTDYFGKCENIHGHRWRVVVIIGTQSLVEDGPESAMVMDFGRFKKAVQKVCSELDHKFLLEQDSLSDDTKQCLLRDGFVLKEFAFRTTAENLAYWFFEQLRAQGLPIIEVQMYETPMNCAIYRKDS